jgi:hypothetical protein
MIAEARSGPQVITDGSVNEIRLSKDSSLVTQDSHGRYQEALFRGNVYALNVNGAAATAFTGATGGTPLAAIYNPAGSGKNFVILGIMIGNRAAASAAGVVTFNLWGGPTVLPTGTLTQPLNMLTLAATGSSAKGWVNAATTGSTAIGQLFPVASYYWATAASALLAGTFFDVAGMAICIPGNMIALGATAALTAATWDATLIWEEIGI